MVPTHTSPSFTTKARPLLPSPPGASLYFFFFSFFPSTAGSLFPSSLLSLLHSAPPPPASLGRDQDVCSVPGPGGGGGHDTLSGELPGVTELRLGERRPLSPLSSMTHVSATRWSGVWLAEGRKVGLSVGRTVMANYLNFPMVPSPVQAGESQLSFPSSSHIQGALSDLLFLGFLWPVAPPGFQHSALPWLPSYLYPGSSPAGLRALLCLHSLLRLHPLHPCSVRSTCITSCPPWAEDAQIGSLFHTSLPGPRIYRAAPPGSYTQHTGKQSSLTSTKRLPFHTLLCSVSLPPITSLGASLAFSTSSPPASRIPP